jgi:class 3 adenylate cyclase
VTHEPSTVVPRAATTTILFTDLVNSVELLQRAGDEGAQRVFQAHHALLKDAVAAHGGQEKRTKQETTEQMGVLTTADGVQLTACPRAGADVHPHRAVAQPLPEQWSSVQGSPSSHASGLFWHAPVASQMSVVHVLPSSQFLGWVRHLVPMGGKVVVANPALQPPFTDASEIVVSGPDDGTIVLANGFGSHGETVKRTRDRDGHVCELAGGTLVPRTEA